MHIIDGDFMMSDVQIEREDPAIHRIYVASVASTLTQQGHLVMRAGAANAMREKFPEIEKMAGAMVRHLMPDFGFMIACRISPLVSLGIMQVKRGMSDPIAIHLLGKSLRELAAVAAANPKDIFRVNFPGIGLGGLHPDNVRNLMAYCNLPPNVYFFQTKTPLVLVDPSVTPVASTRTPPKIVIEDGIRRGDPLLQREHPISVGEVYHWPILRICMYLDSLEHLTSWEFEQVTRYWSLGDHARRMATSLQDDLRKIAARYVAKKSTERSQDATDHPLTTSPHVC